MVSEGMLPRAAVKEVEARLTGGGLSGRRFRRPGAVPAGDRPGTSAFLTVHWMPPKRQSSKN